jgi:hypothetical protein
MYTFRKPNKAYIPFAVLLICGFLSACFCSCITLKPSQESESLSYKVEIVYFHRTDQCPCMQKIEDNIRDTIFSNFKKELDSGQLTYASLAADDRANGAMVAKYNTGLFGLFIVIVKDKTETIVPVEEIWTMTGDETIYKEYVKSIVSRYLAGEP